MAYQRFYDVVRDAYGNGVPGASIAVYNAGTTTLATIYSSSGGVAPSSTANPLTSASDGSYGFAATTGAYDIVITANGLATRYLYNVSILGDMTAYSGTLTAASINNVPAGNIASTDVQSALNELDTEKAIDANVVHLSGGETITGVKAFSAQPTGIAGSSISNTPAGNIAATTVQAAINELDSEKAIDTAVVHITGVETVTGTKTFSAVFTVSNGTASTLTTNGALVVTGGVGIGGAINVGGAAAITGNTTLSGTCTVGSFLTLASTTGGSNTGQIWYDTTQKSVARFAAAAIQYDNTVLAVGTNSTTVGNTTSELTLLGTVVGTKTIPANFFVVGKTIKLRVWGFGGNAGVGTTLNFKFKLGATVVATTGAVAENTITGTLPWYFEAILTCRTTGAGGTVFCQGQYLYFTSTSGTSAMPAGNAATVAIDTTVSQLVDLTATWGAAAGANTLTSTNWTLEVCP